MALILVEGTTFNFITLRGEPEPVGLEVDVISRPGVNGHAYWQEGKRGKVFEMEGTADTATLSDAATTFESMKAKQGKLGTVTDDRGRTYTNVAILAVERVSIRRISGAVGGLLAGAATALLVVRFKMQSTK